MKKLLIVYHAGAMANPRAIYSALARAGNFEVSVVVPQRMRIDRVYDSSGWLTVEHEEAADGYRLMPVALRNPENYWQGFESGPLRQCLHESQADLIHVFDEPVSGYLYQLIWARWMARRQSKVLFFGFDNLPIRLGPRARVLWWLAWRQMAGGVAANSEALENVRRAGFPAKRPLERVFWGVSTEVFRPMKDSGLRAELGLENKRVVGFVGRKSPEKGVRVLMEAMQNLPPEVHCLLIGSGPMAEEIEKWAARPEMKGRVHLREPMNQSELARHMNCMDVLALPSLTTPKWKEQYGRVLAEAMACGVPVVGSDSGAIPEVIGEAGLVAKEDDARALAQALETALFDGETQERLKRRGLERAEAELSVSAMARQLTQFYARVLGAAN